MENDLSTADGSLKDLLNSEHYLEKVLKHLVDEGRYDCRLVCRKWNDVCSRLPVKLVNVPVKKLPIIVDRFPNAVALYVYPFIDWDDETEEAIQSLARLNNLGAIELHGVFRHMTPNDALPFCSSLAEALKSCQLRLLSIFPLPDVEAGMLLYSHFSHLTGLTRLAIEGGWEQLVDDPYTEVRNIEDLRIQSVCLESGQLVFPSLTHLTRLTMHCDVEPAKNFRGGALQMILPYARSLQSLRIDGSHCFVAVNTEWKLFQEFRQLSSAEFVMLDFDASQDFCAALGCLNLTHLAFYSCQFSTDFVDGLASVRSLSNLRSFTFDSLSGNPHELFLMMPQLTQLRMCELNDIEALAGLTALKNLEFEPTAQIFSVSDVFCCMTGLESLDMMSDNSYLLQTSCLTHLRELRSLSLNRFNLSEDIFRSLAQLSGLTKLNISNCDLQSVQWSEINALTNLETLELWYIEQTADRMSALLEGKLSKLVSLSVDEDTDDESNHWRSLYQNLPNLRQCFIMNRETGTTVHPDGFI